MYNEAKKARQAMKNKAKRLASANNEKVDSSDFTPAEPINADVKTGMRPVSRRAYKSGGKVEGEAAKKNAGRSPRANGGKAKAYANALVNRNAKDANEEREGKKHIGGMKSGGRAKRAEGGKLKDWEARALFDKYNASKQAESEQKLREKQKAQKVNESLTSSGLKSGGRAKKLGGGALDALSVFSPAALAYNLIKGGKDDKEEKKNGGRAGRKAGGRAKREEGGEVKNPPIPPRRSDYFPEEGKKPEAKDLYTPEQLKRLEAGRKSGGRTKKNVGGPMMDPRLGMVKNKALPGGDGILVPGMKKGGKVHKDEAMDKALIKKMVKPEARKGKADGGSTKYLGAGRKGDPDREAAEKEFGPREDAISRAMNQMEGEFSPWAMRKMRSEIAARRAGNKDLQAFAKRRKDRAEKESMEKAGYKKGGRTARATGGMIEDTKKALMIKADPHNQSKIKPAETKKEPAEAKACGGRMARKSGGRAKGKTNINIVISTAGKPAMGGPGDMPMPPMPGGKPPAGVPVPMPPAGGPPGGGAPMAMPVPMPMPAPQHPGAGAMGRKAGGRVSKMAKSYKDMEAGAGSGEGRLQKTDIAKRTNTEKKENGTKTFSGKGYPNKVPGATGGRTARKAGGKVYRSYKDMDAGAGSGEGRLEKTEIAKHKK